MSRGKSKTGKLLSNIYATEFAIDEYWNEMSFQEQARWENTADEFLYRMNVNTECDYADVAEPSKGGMKLHPEHALRAVFGIVNRVTDEMEDHEGAPVKSVDDFDLIGVKMKRALQSIEAIIAATK